VVKHLVRTVYLDCPLIRVFEGVCRIVEFDIASVQCRVGAAECDDASQLSARGLRGCRPSKVKTDILVGKVVCLLELGPKRGQLFI